MLARVLLPKIQAKMSTQLTASVKNQIMTEIKGTFVTESELRNETVNLGNDIYAQIRGLAKKMDEMNKQINRPNDYVDLESLKTRLQHYTMKEDVEDMILAQRIDSKAPKQ